MRIAAVGAVNRASDVDRNPTWPAGLWYLATAVAPHAQVIRATYTVPTGRKVRVGNIHMDLLRVTVAAPIGMSIQALFSDLHTTISIPDFIVAQRLNKNNTVDYIDQLDSATTYYFGAGRVLNFTTEDQSTGGTTTMHGGVNLMEFDA